MQTTQLASNTASACVSVPVAPERIYAWLQAVSDPEIPVLSVVDLGIIREIHWENGVCVVVITPTYSGCPAMGEMTRAIQETLCNHGVMHHRIQTRLAPAWTTDWMTPKGKQALRDYGIAAPVGRAVDACTIDISALRRPADEPCVACPRCGSHHTRMISQFGAAACKALYCCMDCREPFDYFKPH